MRAIYLKLLASSTLVLCSAVCHGQQGGQGNNIKPKPAPKKDVAVVRNERTGQIIQVKVPKDAATVTQTGNNTYNVQKNPDATKQIEVKPLPTPPQQ